ncbi:MAG: hypothetical protein ABIJ26_02490 [Candidatus Margulisiibacteriota bacterium]
MKKLSVAIVLSLFVLQSLSSAQLLIGARSAGMGGTGVAVSRNIPSVYYNPAAFMRSGTGQFLLSLGASYSNYDKLLEAIQDASDPAQFLIKNYANAYNFNGSASGLLGFNIAKVGISAIPVGSATLNKAANTLAGSINANSLSYGALTLGHTFKVSWLPASLDVGTNLKYIFGYMGALTATSAGGTQAWSTGSGVGLDLGALTEVSVPWVTKMSLGFAARDLFASVNFQNYTQALISTGTTFTYGPTVDLGSTSTPINSSYVLGVGATVPVVNMLLAADLENVSGSGNMNTHIGIEYPLFMGALVLRAGLASGNNLSDTTFGVGFGFPFMTMDLAYVADGLNSSNSSYVFDFGIGL